MILKIVPKAVCECTLEKINTNESEEKTEQKCDAAFWTNLELVSGFQKSKQKLYSYLSPEHGRQKIKDNSACIESILIL